MRRRRVLHKQAWRRLHRFTACHELADALWVMVLASSQTHRFISRTEPMDWVRTSTASRS